MVAGESGVVKAGHPDEDLADDSRSKSPTILRRAGGGPDAANIMISWPSRQAGVSAPGIIYLRFVPVGSRGRSGIVASLLASKGLVFDGHLHRRRTRSCE